MSASEWSVATLPSVDAALAEQGLSPLDGCDLESAHIWVLPMTAFGEPLFARESEEAVEVAEESDLDVRLYTVDEHPQVYVRKAAALPWMIPALLLLETIRQVPSAVLATYITRYLDRLARLGFLGRQDEKCTVYLRRPEGTVLRYQGPSSTLSGLPKLLEKAEPE